MTTQFKTLISPSGIGQFSKTALRLAIVGGISASLPFFAAAQDTRIHAHDSAAPAELVAKVRIATQQFLNVNAATAAGYGPFLGCVSGPDHGAMGIHYVNPGFVGDGLIDVNKPEALIYEPTVDGLKLVGVEFIVDAAAWNLQNNAPPVLFGQVFNLITAPNRFGLAAFYELHVWAWRDNPNGAFVDWNNRVTCEGQ